jgi:hypothetical protein
LSRAATLAFSATFVSATAISACGGDAEESGTGNNAGAAGLPLYGGPSGEDAGMGGTINVPGAAGASGEAGAGAAPDDTGGKGGGPVAVYGGPP